MMEMKSDGILAQIITLPNFSTHPLRRHNIYQYCCVADDSLQCDLISNFVPVLGYKHPDQEQEIHNNTNNDNNNLTVITEHLL